jgi:hypothetical protein
MQNVEAKLTKRDKQLHVPLEKNVDGVMVEKVNDVHVFIHSNCWGRL